MAVAGAATVAAVVASVMVVVVMAGHPAGRAGRHDARLLHLLEDRRGDVGESLKKEVLLSYVALVCF